MTSLATACKLCGCDRLVRFGHTARCRGCGAMLYYPYPTPNLLPHNNFKDGRPWDGYEAWYYAAASRNHTNFTNQLRFAAEGWATDFAGDVLDYGGGGGQFALVVSSHFPNVTTWFTDINQNALLRQWRPFNRPIPFSEFPRDPTKFDAIFLNDVYEHVESPHEVMRLLATKLKPGGRVFVDTPKVFWLYPLLRIANRRLYARLCRGTISRSHLQIWTRRAFETVTRAGGLRIERYRECSELTMPATYYLDLMGIRQPLLRLLGRVFHRSVHVLARNKIMAVLRPIAPAV